MHSHNKFSKLIIFEMANNHMGNVSHAEKIIKTYKNIAQKYNYNFAFKLQYRDLNSFIHKAFKNRSDFHYVKRFNETKLSENQFNKIINTIKKNKFKAIATPFDEKSVDLIVKQNLDFIKVASCSFDDWPLLEKISLTNKPIILSTAGAEINTIDKVVSFLKNRKKLFCLMHCVAEYPTPFNKLNLGRISLLKKRYLDIPIGYSSHELPENFENIKIAISNGAEIFEKHVGLATKKYLLNKYSISPNQTKDWLSSLDKTYKSLKISPKKNKKEEASLRSLRRGVYLNKNIKKNYNITRKDVYFAFPPVKNQLTSNEFSKYLNIKTKISLKKDMPITIKNSKISNSRDDIYKILKKIKKFISQTGISYPENLKLEISHHYGIDKFDKFGLTMLTVVNRKYCKKILFLLPKQSHPTQFHKIKEETFNIIYGSCELYLNGKLKKCSVGDVITIKPKVRHFFKTKKGCVIEEISTNHKIQDSFYIDKSIMRNKNRKTILNYWHD